MDKFFDLLLDFAKDNGVGVSVPIAIWIVVKTWMEDRRSKKEVVDQNHDDIGDLKVKMASLEATVEALKDAVY